MPAVRDYIVIHASSVGARGKRPFMQVHPAGTGAGISCLPHICFQKMNHPESLISAAEGGRGYNDQVPGIPEPEQEYVWNPAFSLLKMKPPLP
jgi:hypothetical protein